MKAVNAAKLLAVEDKTWRHVYSKGELGELFDEAGSSLTATIRRLCDEGILKRATKGIYAYQLTQHFGVRTIDQIACKMRPGKLLYESLECAAFYWDLISRGIYVSTYVTNGAAGRFETAYGPISFVHMPLTEEEVAEVTISRDFDQRVPLATKRRTFEDMVRSQRSICLLREQYMKDVIGIDGTVVYLPVEDDDTWDFLTPDEEEWLAVVPDRWSDEKGPRYPASWGKSTL